VDIQYVVKVVELPNQVKLQYVEQGNSSDISLILLHGYADSWRTFEPMLTHLPDSIRTFALTQRGHGESSRPENGYRTNDFTSDLLSFMDTLNIDDAVIAGGSSGGFVARRFAIDNPNRTLGLVLIGSPLTMRDKASVLELRDSTISKLTDPIDQSFVRGFVESTLTQPVPELFLETLVQESLKVPARVWKATLEGLLEDDSSEELFKIKAPTLIVWGDKDTVVPRSDQETFTTAIANSQLLVYPNAGHALYCEEPVHFASDVTDFIEELRR
jgi:non-heme chloroperoxidase